MTTDTPTGPQVAPAPPSPVPSGAGTPALPPPSVAASQPPASAGSDADGSAGAAGEGDPETFDRAYVERLRAEAAGHRVRAKAADSLRSEVVRLVAGSTNLMADASDLTPTDDMFDLDGKPDITKITEAVQALVHAKPHLAARQFGDVAKASGQRQHAAHRRSVRC